MFLLSHLAEARSRALLKMVEKKLLCVGEKKTANRAALSQPSLLHSLVPLPSLTRQWGAQLGKGDPVKPGAGTKRDTIKTPKICCCLQRAQSLFGETRLAWQYNTHHRIKLIAKWGGIDSKEKLQGAIICEDGVCLHDGGSTWVRSRLDRGKQGRCFWWKSQPGQMCRNEQV